MAQILITHSKDLDLYSPVASIRLYSEPGFEKKLLRYARKIFPNYYVFPFKFGMDSDLYPGEFYEPDLILISKSFKKWVIVEVELCKTPTSHTKKQILTFSNPRLNPEKIRDHIVKQNRDMIKFSNELEECFTNYRPDFLVVLNDYDDLVFQKFRDVKEKLKICVLEVYKRVDYSYDGYRFGGDYPYELTNSSKLKRFDDQHYQILKKDFADDLPDKLEIRFNNEPFDATVARGRTTFLKIPEHNISEEFYLQMGMTSNNEYIMQRL